MASRVPFNAFPWREGVVPVEVDGELLLLDADAGQVVRLSGVAKAAVEQHRSVRPTGLPRDTPAVIDALAGLGLLQEDMPSSDRRSVLRAGALAALGLSVLSLPAAAAAATGGDSGDGLFAAGTGDETFTAAGAPNGYVMAIQSQPDGRIYIGGGFTQVGGVARGRLARLNSDGTLDTTFANPALAADVLDLDVDQRDGAVLVGGANALRVRRMHSNGAADASFVVSNLYNSLNTVSGPAVEAVRVRSDGRIYIGGQFTHVAETDRLAIAALHPNGALDTDFGSAGLGSWVRTVGLSGNSVVVGGDFATPYRRLARILPNGAIDPTMTDPNVNGVVRKLSVDGSGGVLIAGEFSSVGGSSRSKVARVQANGTVDGAFVPPVISGGSGDVRSILVQSDGRVIVGGRFTSPKGYIVRLEANGALEADFDVSADGNVWSLALDAFGRLLVGGQFANIGGLARPFLGRID